MTATAVFSTSITSTIINKGVLSYEGSKIFIQKLIPTTVGLILYHRTDIDRSNFEQRNCNGLKFITFKRVVSNKVLKEICRWSMGVLDAFKKEYLKELHFMFVDVHDSFKILESFKFHFEYGNRNISHEKVSKCSLKTAVSELFKSITNINVEPLKDGMFIPYMCITYCDNVPLNYRAPHFNTDTEQDELANRLASNCKKFIRLGQTSTGFHTIKCQCCVPGWNPNSETVENSSIQEVHTSNQTELGTNEIVDSSISLFQTDLRVNNCSTPKKNTVIDVSDDDMEIESELNNIQQDSCETVIDITDVYDGKIDCVCLLKKKFFNIDLVECSYCCSLQHLPCLGYLFVESLEKKYICYRCKNEKLNISYRTLCRFRLLTAHTFFNGTFPDEVCDLIKPNIKNGFVRILKLNKVIQYVIDKYIVDDNNMDVFIEKVFPENLNIRSIKDLGIVGTNTKFL
ncbi:hypothetical protein RN001_013604 [Aquatica leii]|uniref:HORMA domain-containing protein n=1 Tax=Aquatica leii TaxID=1421715 RepID=A0AAN7SE02_9COLE|nr:hypothetical protein RN001_013604 [Aquatica leii]